MLIINLIEIYQNFIRFHHNVVQGWYSAWLLVLLTFQCHSLQLEIAINNTPTLSLVNINTCKSYIKINTSLTNTQTGYRGLHIMDKLIHFRCMNNNENNKTCILDAQSLLSRNLYIINSNVAFTGIAFQNGVVFKNVNNNTNVLWWFIMDWIFYDPNEKM